MEAVFFTKNRNTLLDSLKKGALVVLTGYGEMQRSSDSATKFEQEANFWYLTGIEAPDWWMIIDGSSGAEWLVSPDLTPAQEVFDGALTSEQAYRSSGIKTVISRDEAMRRLRELAKHHSIVYTTEQPRSAVDHATFQLNHSQSELKKILERTFKNIQICNLELAVQRAIKQPEEILAIERAVNLTVSAFEVMKKKLRTAKHEYELEAELDYEIRRRGGVHAYDPIVAAGVNACTLHYGQNQAPLRRRDLVLLDVGARVDGYAADISRTYALGKPSKRQIEIHTAVQTAQQECISMLRPGLTYTEYYAACDVVMKRAVQAVGLSQDKYRDYFPHAMGHGLGIDVHDLLAGYHEFQPGMVLTVEPGLYVPEEGIGVRIEDDILITESGYKNLSARLSTDIS